MNNEDDGIVYTPSIDDRTLLLYIDSSAIPPGEYQNNSMLSSEFHQFHSAISCVRKLKLKSKSYQFPSLQKH